MRTPTKSQGSEDMRKLFFAALVAVAVLVGQVVPGPAIGQADSVAYADDSGN
jgi:hypothetical protein